MSNANVARLRKQFPWWEEWMDHPKQMEKAFVEDLHHTVSLYGESLGIDMSSFSVTYATGVSQPCYIHGEITGNGRRRTQYILHSINFYKCRDVRALKQKMDRIAKAVVGSIDNCKPLF